MAASQQRPVEKAAVEKVAVETRSPATNGAAPMTAPAPLAADAKFTLVGGTAAPTLAPAPPTQHHLPLRPIVALLIVVGAGAAIWWAITTTGWTPPWMQPPGPLTASGTLEADEVLVGSQVSARILELAQEGQSVQADAVVAKLDDSLVQLQILQADVARRQQLEIEVERYQLHSPISGVITRVPLHIGEIATPGQTVVAVADLTNLDLTAYVLERDLGQVRVGEQVTVTADPFPGRGFRGVVTSTNPRAEFTPRNIQTQADRLNLVFGVKIRVENPDGALKPGMPADVIFPSAP